jgi:hypothetical protein
MANKQMLITCFNNKLEEFLKDLINTFPEDNDFKLFKNSFSLLKQLNPKQPQQIFHKYAPEYKQHILDRDDQFFLDKSYDEIQEAKQYLKSDVIADVVNKLKGYWLQLDTSNREIVWQYLNLLIILDDKCASAN